MIMRGFGMGLPGRGVVDDAFPVITAHRASPSLNLQMDKVGYCNLMLSIVPVKAASVSFAVTVYRKCTYIFNMHV